MLHFHIKPHSKLIACCCCDLLIRLFYFSKNIMLGGIFGGGGRDAPMPGRALGAAPGGGAGPALIHPAGQQWTFDPAGLGTNAHRASTTWLLAAWQIPPKGHHVRCALQPVCLLAESNHDSLEQLLFKWVAFARKPWSKHACTAGRCLSTDVEIWLSYFWNGLKPTIDQ